MRIRASKPDGDCALLIIGGLNTKGEDEHWDFSDLGFDGECHKIPWESWCDFPDGFSGDLPVKAVETVSQYLDVLRRADQDGKALAEEFASHPITHKRVFVLAHSMGTRVAASFLRYAVQLGADSTQFGQVFLFNGAAPVHPKFDLREIGLNHTSGRVHNFFNPADPVIGWLNLICFSINLLQVALLGRIPSSLHYLLEEDAVGSHLGRPIGGFATSNANYNYNINAIQGADHGLGKLSRFIKFDPIRRQFDVSPQQCDAIPLTLGEIVHDIRDAILKDPSKTSAHYLRPLSREQWEIVENLCGTRVHIERVICSTCEITQEFQSQPNIHERHLKDLDQVFHTLSEKPTKQRPMLTPSSSFYLEI
jgi:hypothetical protein